MVSWITFSKLRQGIKVTQESYANQLLELFDLGGVRTYDTPMSATFYDDVINADITDTADTELYRNMIGSLTHLASKTRPDIAAAVNILAQYNRSPNKFVLQAVKKSIWLHQENY